ncbi:hypothetical protein HC031_29980 [Planosporangium thailandense]|uniref:Uncharacterized protein n=1 Tax=Planosporangium thailandense TaxID=765197 RepID=A0ABX0Y930_9ACTN|nr:hypothetical protein [Planosporangium thailandense]NJC73910.1 hypothetical protein [Planosporangium thailandense]
MAVTRLRRWWGSWRLRPFAAGLTLLAITVAAGSGVSTAVTPGPSGGTTVTATSAPTPYAVPGSPAADLGAADLGAAVRSAKPDGCAAGAITSHDSHGHVAPCGVLSDRSALDGSARQTTAEPDVPAPLGVACAPRASRAPPLHLA